MRKRMIILGLLAVFIAAVYFSPDEAYWHQERSWGLALARKAAWSLYLGQERHLLDMPSEPAFTKKIKDSNFRELASYDAFKTLEPVEKRLAHKHQWIYMTLANPILNPERDDLELIALDRLDSFVVMTFAYMRMDKVSIVEIPGKGKLYISVGIRYYNPDDDRFLPKLVRKVANLWIIRDIPGMSALGTTGHWTLFDYHLPYYLTDYHGWFLAHADEAFAREMDELNADIEMNLEDLFASSDAGLDFLVFTWGQLAAKNQVARITEYKTALNQVEDKVQSSTRKN